MGDESMFVVRSRPTGPPAVLFLSRPVERVSPRRHLYLYNPSPRCSPQEIEKNMSGEQSTEVAPFDLCCRFMYDSRMWSEF